jgi:hypothetical protein
MRFVLIIGRVIDFLRFDQFCSPLRPQGLDSRFEVLAF